MRCSYFFFSVSFFIFNQKHSVWFYGFILIPTRSDSLHAEKREKKNTSIIILEFVLIHNFQFSLCISKQNEKEIASTTNNNIIIRYIVVIFLWYYKNINKSHVPINMTINFCEFHSHFIYHLFIICYRLFELTNKLKFWIVFRIFNGVQFECRKSMLKRWKFKGWENRINRKFIQTANDKHSIE